MLKWGWRHQNKGQGTGGSSDILKWAEGVKRVSGKLRVVM